MRRGRRGGSKGMEFGGSGEDSFVAVVVTKLTGALLFILLLTMVIMALLQKAMDQSDPSTAAPTKPDDLAIATPDTLPEAIVGRPYNVALAARGGAGRLKWSVHGELPKGLELDTDEGFLSGTPAQATPDPALLTLRVSDAQTIATKSVRLAIYKPDTPLILPSTWKPSLAPVPWRAWMEQGFGFLVLWLVHLVGMNTLSGIERWSLAKTENASEGLDDAQRELLTKQTQSRFRLQRRLVRLTTLATALGLACWLAWPRH